MLGFIAKKLAYIKKDVRNQTSINQKDDNFVCIN